MLAITWFILPRSSAASSSDFSHNGLHASLKSNSLRSCEIEAPEKVGVDRDKFDFTASPSPGSDGPPVGRNLIVIVQLLLSFAASPIMCVAVDMRGFLQITFRDAR
jgi:hypothetical protein